MESVNNQANKKAPIFIVLAASCWGIIGIFIRVLSKIGFNPIQITATRCIVTAIILTIYLSIKDKKKLIIEKKDIWYFMGTGIGSIVFFNICYFTTIQETTLSIASILLYTSPFFVIILSAIFFQEKITLQKLIALCIAFIGCILITGIIGTQGVKLTGYGILTGIGSGIGFSLYSIFGRIALKKYHILTVTSYTFIVATVALFPFSNVGEMFKIIKSNKLSLSNILLIGILSTLIPFLLYNKGLQNMEAGKASVMAFVEPVVATIVGIILYGERINIQNGTGIILIFLSLVLLNLSIPIKKEYTLK